jgi:tricorn protease
MKTRFALITVLAITGFITMAFAQQEARLLRFPAIHGNQIAFTYAGDLYSVSATGGVARKLTNDVGFEMFARFSPDGKQAAFTAKYGSLPHAVRRRGSKASDFYSDARSR